jgi:hypothetical protein
MSILHGVSLSRRIANENSSSCRAKRHNAVVRRATASIASQPSNQMGRMTMRTRYSRLISSGAIALLLAVTISLVQAAPNPLPPNANAYGEGYAELTADWLEWVLAIPAASNPLLDPDGAFAAVGQSGKVWFLVGTVGGPATRTVTVPADAALFFPIVNYFWVNTPEYGDPPWSPAQEASVRSFLGASIDTAYGLILEIDGRTGGRGEPRGPRDQSFDDFGGQ